MDQERAKKLFHYGATFLFLDVPEGTEFGMDCNAWTVGPKFKGVTMIPPGLHFIHFSPVSRTSDGDVGHRTGFFYDFKAEEMVVRAWDPREETIRTVEDHPSSSACSSSYSSSSSPSSKEYNAARKRELDPFLAPY